MLKEEIGLLQNDLIDLEGEERLSVLIKLLKLISPEGSEKELYYLEEAKELALLFGSIKDQAEVNWMSRTPRSIKAVAD